MGKNGLLIGAVVVVIVLGAIGFMVMGKNKPSNTMAPSASPSPKQESGMISSIKDALAKSMSLECDYATPQGVNVKAYIKNGKIRSDITGKTAAETGSSIIMDKTMYFWNAQTAMKMTLPDVSVTPAAGQDKMMQNDTGVDALEQYKNHCHAAAVDDSHFVLPTGVKFQDLSSMMKTMTPSGTKTAPTGGAMTQEQIQEMMKKYQNPQQ